MLADMPHPYEHSWRPVADDGETFCACGRRFSHPIHLEDVDKEHLSSIVSAVMRLYIGEINDSITRANIARDLGEALRLNGYVLRPDLSGNTPEMVDTGKVAVDLCLDTGEALISFRL